LIKGQSGSSTIGGSLAASGINISGAHAALSGGSGGAAIRNLNPNIIGFDNLQKEYPQSAAAFVDKFLRIAGKGNCRFRIYFNGRLYIHSINNATGELERILETTQSFIGYYWSDIVNLRNDINIIRFRLYSYSSTSWAAMNTICEARCNSSPGLFKYFSSPF